MKITILGGGNLGKSIALGLKRTAEYGSADIVVTRKHQRPLPELMEEGIPVLYENEVAISGADYIILCVQPKQIAQVLHNLDINRSKSVLISTVTGVSINDIIQHTDSRTPIVRAVPNTAIAIQESMTCISARNVPESTVNEVEKIFQVMGKTLVIDEELMAAATVLGASGIAFCLRYIRAASQGGIQMGFHAEEAHKIAVQTCKGAAGLLSSLDNHPESEIDKVTTPQGCTIAGLNEMEHNGLSSAVIKGIVASHHRISNIKDD